LPYKELQRVVTGESSEDWHVLSSYVHVLGFAESNAHLDDCCSVAMAGTVRSKF
jgi:hypothetical protein